MNRRVRDIFYFRLNRPGFFFSFLSFFLLFTRHMYDTNSTNHRNNRANLRNYKNNITFRFSRKLIGWFNVQVKDRFLAILSNECSQSIARLRSRTNYFSIGTYVCVYKYK